MHKLYRMIPILIFLFASAVPAQQHTRLLYHAPLTSNEPNPIGKITSYAGEFSSQGWRATSGSGQLRIDCAAMLPAEGTMEVTMKGMMPTISNEWILFALHSRSAGNFDEVDPSPASYAFIKTEPKYASLNRDFKFVTAAFYGANPSTERRTSEIAKRTWDRNREYKFAIVWNRSSIKVMVDNQVLAEHPFLGQVESFGYIFLGRDNYYKTTMTGVTYKDLKIWGPETSFPFTNIAVPSAEMAERQIGGQGLTIADLDGNGSEDFYLSRFMAAGVETPNLLYMQTGGAFKEESATRNVADVGYSYQSLAADFDGDGDQDLFVVNFHRSPDYVKLPNKLYLNTGSGSFSDASTRLSGDSPGDCNGGTVIDIDRDGDFDIVVVCQAGQHKVYVNDGRANFTVQTRGLENFRSSANKYQAVTSGDLDGDGFQDLVLVHETGAQIAKNNGAGTFVTGANLSFTGIGSAATLADWDNDGDADIFIANRTSGRVEVYRNDGNFAFTNVSGQWAVPVNTPGVVLGDWNNDGKLDLFATAVNDQPTATLKLYGVGRLFINDGTRFIERTGTGADMNFADGRGAGTLDSNNDGKLDIYVISRGGQATDAKTGEKKPYGRNYLFRNDIQSGKNYLKVKIADASGNAVGIGAKIFVYRNGSYGNASALLGYRELVAVNGYKSQSSLIQHFGVDQATMVDVKVIMPDGSERRHVNVPVNQTLTVLPRRADASRLVRDFNFSQRAVAGQPYELVYRVLTTDDQPVAGHPVVFTILSGNGSLSPASSVTSQQVLTEGDGRARIQWYLGPLAGAAGINQIRTTSEFNGAPLVGSPDVYELIAAAGAPAVLTKAGGDAQSGFINEPLPQPLRASVTDRFGNAVSGQQVQFTIASGGGRLTTGGSLSTQITLTSDANGIVQVNWILGAALGLQTVYVTSDYNGTALQNSPLTFAASAQEPLRRLLYISGDRQTAQINTELPQSLRVRLVDRANAPLSGEVIRFKALTFGAKFSGSDSINVLTDSQGYASARPTLGSAAGDTIYVFEARAQNASGSPVVFKASAVPGPPTRIVYIAGNNQTGPAGRNLPEPLKVRLLDVLDNPVKNYQVRFAVTEGSGSFNGESSIVVLSDAQGFAQAVWQLGPRVGRNTAVAAAVGTPLPQINFTATGITGPAARLVKSGGDNQKGVGGQALNEYFVVTVTDSFYNPIANHAVTFRVAQGGGSLNGRTEITEYTNAFGQAQALYTMGPTDYEQRVEAVAQRNNVPLIDSPQVFRAFLAPGDPETLLYVSGNNQIGRVNAELPEPFVVRVVDKNGIGVNNVEVSFVSFTPGAGFSGSPTITKLTDANGYARATATLGSNYGTNNYVFEAVARFKGKSLRNSPLQFFASGRISLAKKMRKLNGEQLYTGFVGQVVDDSLQVLILDENDRPVAGHPVTFQVTAGTVFLDGQRTTLEAVSNGRGIAGVAVRLATRPGRATVRASSHDGVNPLSPAYLDFSIETLVGLPDAATSSITAVSNVVADGQTSSPVTVRLRDRYNNPIVSQPVSLQTMGVDVFVSQPALPTDAEGLTRGSITSINIGKVTVYAMVNQQPIVSTQIEFIAGPPSLVSVLNAGQSQEKGKTLPLPVGVLVQDAWAHPVNNLPVYFTVLRGGGSIREPQPVLTAEDGRAMVTWTLGDTLSDAQHEQKLRVRIEGIAQPVDILAYALPPAQGRLQILSGDSLIALVNQPLPAAFRVKVTDPSGKPITNFPIDFSILQGQGEWLTTPRPYTNQQGEAQALLRAGAQQGLHLVRATAGNYGAVLFTLIVQNQRTISLIKLSPDGLQVRPKAELNVSVKALDAFNRPLQGESIQVLVTLGQGHIKETMPLRTGTDGIARVTWVAGLSGTERIEFKALNALHPPTTFTIIVINSAPAFSPPLQRNRTVESGNALQFQVRAVDPDGDPVFYSVRNLPRGAQFDADATQTFRWMPTNADAGDHLVTFRVADLYHAADSTIVRITVVARNSAPQILGFSPADTVLILPFNSPLGFEVQAIDPDNDPLSFAWMVSTPRDELFAGDQPTLPVIIFSKQAFPDSFAVVRVIVSDGSEQVGKSWRIHLSKLAAVELETFHASVRDGRVELQWKIKSAKNLLGFTVQRSRSREGQFTPISTFMILPQTDGNYTFTDDQVQAGERWYYKLLEHESTGAVNELGIAEAMIELPKEFALRQNYPNPFNPTTTIRFDLPSSRPVKLAIYSLTGKVIRILADEEFSAGVHAVVWDARDESGQFVPSGIYYCRITAGDFTQYRKMMLLK